MGIQKNELDVIYRRYYRDVMCYAKSLVSNIDVAEEITQNTFLKAVQSAHKFRGECDIRVWLCQIAKHDYLNYLRKERRLLKGEDAEKLLANIPAHEEPILTRLEDEESAREIQNKLEEMEEPYKEVFILRVVHEKSYADIAAIYGKSESWARVTYYRAKMKIAGKMT